MKTLVHSLFLASFLSGSMQAQERNGPGEIHLSTTDLHSKAGKIEHPPIADSSLPETLQPIGHILAPTGETQQEEELDEVPVAGSETEETSIPFAGVQEKKEMNYTLPEASLPSAQYRPPEQTKKIRKTEWESWVVGAGIVLSATAGLILVSMNQGSPDPNR